MTELRLRQERLRKVQVIAEDDDLLVVDKPAGLAVHPGADTKGRDLLSVLVDAYDGPVDLHLGHRLDRGTSGVLLILKAVELLNTLQALWPSATKWYWAAVVGRLREPRRIETPLLARDGRMQDARSDVAPIVEGKVSIVQVVIQTGRQHQIRRHLASIGHPVLMDDKYGDFAANKAWSREVRDRGTPRPKHLLLHSVRLAVVHPRSGAELNFNAPIPSVWRAWIPDAPVEPPPVEPLSVLLET